MKLYATSHRYYGGRWHRDLVVTNSAVWSNIGSVTFELICRVARFLHCIK